MNSIDNTYPYLVIGGGIAGISAARAIRERDSAGKLLLVSDEDRIPYKRTKISKFLAAGFHRDEFAIEESGWYPGHSLDLLVDESVVAIDVEARRARLRSGGEVGWERLILATGARPILPAALDGAGEGIYVVRTAEEVEAIRAAALSVRSAIVVGNGVLGVEVAEQLRVLGKDVVLLGSGPRLLSNRFDEELSTRLELLFTSNGVELIANAHVEQIARAADSGSGLSVATPIGVRTADMVVFCVGVRPNIELGREAGLKTRHGILVDRHLLTSHSDVYAAGEVAEHPGGYLSFLWHAAELQGKIAGANAAGDHLVHDTPPFRLKCEVFDNYFFSMSPPASEEGYTVVSSAREERYRRLYFRKGRLSGVLMANEKERAKSYVTAVREGWTESQVAERLPFEEPAGGGASPAT